MSDIHLEIDGFAELLRTLEGAAAKVDSAVASALHDEGEIIKNLSQERVPVDTGNLQSSATNTQTSGGGAIEQTIAYGGPAGRYAWRVHENPRAGKTEGVSPKGRKYSRWAKQGGWKYLESAALERHDGFSQRLADRIREALR